MNSKKLFLIIIVFVLSYSFFSTNVNAKIYWQGFQIEDIKAYEDADYYYVRILIDRTCYTADCTDDYWDFLFTAAWEADVREIPETGYIWGKMYITTDCTSEPYTVDGAYSKCTLTDVTSVQFFLSSYSDPDCPDEEVCCLEGEYEKLWRDFVGILIQADDVSKDYNDDSKEDILIQMQFGKTDPVWTFSWSDFVNYVLDDIYVTFFVDTPGGDDGAVFVWVADSTHVNHEWYFESLDSSTTPSDPGLGAFSSLRAMADSSDDGWGICNDWINIFEPWYKGCSWARVLRYVGWGTENDCDPAICKDPPDGGGSSTAKCDECFSEDTCGVAWASMEDRLGRNIWMQCDTDNSYDICYSYDCDVSENKCISCTDSVEDQDGECEVNCDADAECDEQTPNTAWTSDTTVCNWCTSTCDYGSDSNKPSTYYESGGHCYYDCTVSCTNSGWSRSGCTDGGTAPSTYYTSDSTCYYGCSVTCTASGWQRTGCSSCSLDDYCSGDIRYYNGQCTSTGCSFSSEDCNDYDRGYADSTTNPSQCAGYDYASYTSARQMRDYSCSAGTCDSCTVTYDSYLTSVCVDSICSGDATVDYFQNIQVIASVKNTGSLAQGWWFVGVEFWKVDDPSDPWGTRSQRVDAWYNGKDKTSGCDIAGCGCSYSDPNGNGILDVGETITVTCWAPASHWDFLTGSQRIMFWVHERDLGQDAANNGNGGNDWWTDALSRKEPAEVRVNFSCSGCLIDGICYHDGDPNPANECQYCNSTESKTSWTNRPCGYACTNGRCDGAGTCYTLAGAQTGCVGVLDCSVPNPPQGYVAGVNYTRVQTGNCGRDEGDGLYKRSDTGVCDLTLCTQTISYTDPIDGGWSSIEYPNPTITYKINDIINITVKGIWATSGFTPLLECRLNKTDSTGMPKGLVEFDHWVDPTTFPTDITFSYQIKSTDPSGNWKIDYCILVTDFDENYGWFLESDTTADRICVSTKLKADTLTVEPDPVLTACPYNITEIVWYDFCLTPVVNAEVYYNISLCEALDVCNGATCPLPSYCVDNNCCPNETTVIYPLTQTLENLYPYQNGTYTKELIANWTDGTYTASVKVTREDYENVYDSKNFTVLPDYPNASIFDYSGDLDYFNVFWKGSYRDGSCFPDRELSVECYLDSQTATPETYNIAAGKEGSSTIVNPDYNLTQDGSFSRSAPNKVSCKFYDPEHRWLFGWTNETFRPIEFELAVTSLTATVGKEFSLPLYIKNLGLLTDNYTIQVTVPLYPNLVSISFGNTTINNIKKGETAESYVKLTALTTEPSIRINITVISFSGISASQIIELQGGMASLDEFNFIGIIQIIAIASIFFVFVYLKKE